MAEAKRLHSAFHALNVTQFFGALNDNLFKLFLVLAVLVIRGEAARDEAASLAGVVFVLPFILFNAAAGIIADRHSKSRILVVSKGAELALMVLGLAAFVLHIEWMLFVVLFLMGTQSVFFGPAKYGALPELVERHQLSRANGLIQACTFIAIICGTSLAPWISGVSERSMWAFGGSCIVVSALGFVASLRVRDLPAVGTDARINPLFFVDIWQTLRSLTDRYLLACIFGSAWFLMVGAFVQLYLPAYGEEVLGLTVEQGFALFPFVAFGIGAGSLAAGRLSGRNVEYGVVPLGAIFLCFSLMVLSFVPEGALNLVRALFFLLGFGGGLFIVPLQSYIQEHAPRARLGQVLCASSFLGFSGAALAAVAVAFFGKLDVQYVWFTPRIGFAIIAALTLVLVVVSLWLLPDFLFRFLLLTVTRLIYRIRTQGLEHIPRSGPALLICNHVSYIDAFCIMATQQRRVRFLMSRRMAQLNPAMRLLTRLAGVIPIQGGEARGKIKQALGAARGALDEGYLVCIFAEGHLSRTGQMLPFKSGFEHILKGSDHPVIPVYIGGAWGSISSYAHGPKLFGRLPVEFPYPIQLVFGEPMPPTTKAFAVRQRVLELSTEEFAMRKGQRKPLWVEALRVARRGPRQRRLNDTTGKELRACEAAVAMLALAEVLQRRLDDRPRVGVLLPASVGGALANLALNALGRVSVNLNFTASRSAFSSAQEQCGMSTVITARPFLEKLGELPLPDNVLMLEDLLPQITSGDKARAWLRARLLPLRLLGPRRFDPDEVATIIFSSGSTGDPKGVMLSHHNIQSNVESLRMIARVKPDDHLCAALPLFHSFGYTATLWFPMLSGFAAGYHANPLEAARIAELAQESRSTMLIATPTFLMAWLRKAKPEQFAHLRLVLTGAEKLKAKLAAAFEAKFGIVPLEGYGATELSPVAAVNVPDQRLDGLFQKGNQPGSVGQPVPGVVFRAVDPETLEERVPGEEGLLLVKGPNVMLGYLGQPERTAEVLRGGWYHTGDIGRIDVDGFVTLTDRLARFAKIAGEMVPLGAVEEAMQVLARGSGSTLAVTAVADERKGERLVVLLTPEAGSADELFDKVKAAELPNLWKPDRKAYIPIDELPLLGSGKLDLKRLKSLAETGLKS